MKKLLQLLIAVITGFCAQGQIVPNEPATYSAPAPNTTFPYLSNYNSIPLRNYTRIYTPQQQTTNGAGITLGSSTGAPLVMSAYKDGLGRPFQEVLKTPVPYNAGDMVKVHVYDEQGRESNNYLPYITSNAPGRLKVNPLGDLSGFYGNLYPTDQPYSQMAYDNSPLNRATKMMPPGNSWVGSSVGSQVNFSANKNITSYITGSSAYDFNVLKFTIGHNDINDLPSPNGYFPEGDLMVKKETDEDGNVNLNYTDKGGHNIATMRYMQSPQNAGDRYFHVTYYVYDDFERLRFVITPGAFASTGNTGNLTQAIADGLCYKYWYNAKGLLSQKKQPGVAVEYFVYDKKDRLVLRQNGALRNDGQKWHFITYDVLDRPMMTGVAVTGETQTQWESFFAGDVYTNHTNQELKYFLLKYDLFNEYENTFLYDGDIYTKNYYDSYKNIDLITGSSYSWNAPASMLVPSSAYVPYASPTQQTRGLLVGTRTRIMNNSGTSIDWYKTYNYYDQNGRIIQQRRTPLRGTGVDATTFQYDFSGTLITSVDSHQDLDSTNTPYTLSVVKKYIKEYISGRITSVRQSINGSAFIPIYEDDYDGLGRVANHAMAGAQNYLDYNIRGWLTGINAANMDAAGTSNEYFHEQIFYDKGFTDVHLNGTISGTIWKNYGAAATKNFYGYTYDNANRLAHADFKKWETNMPGPFNSTLSPHWDKSLTDYTASNITYDHNGNLQSMNQRGPDGAATPAPGNIDVMKYHYGQYSNQLLYVQDSGIVSPSVADFTDANTTGVDYDYDANGSMIKDLNKNISSISYWSTYSKPQHIIIAGKGTIDYLYDGAGNKVKQTVIDNTGPTPDTTITDYNGAFIYQNNKLKYILHPEGRCRPINVSSAPNNFTYDYFIKDHIGNVRGVYNLNNVSLGTHLYGTGLEVALAQTESVVWSHLDDVRSNKPIGAASDVKAAELNASDPSQKIGPALSIRVMPGDQFTLDAQTYFDAIGNNEESSGENILNSLFGVLSGGTNMNSTPVAELDDNMQLLQNTVGNPANAGVFNQLLSAVPVSAEAPASYLGYLFFNDMNELVPEKSGLIPFGTVGGEWQNIGTADLHHIDAPGTLTIFAVTDAQYPTFIDNLNFTYYDGNLIEEEKHYYPFGLSISTTAIDPNKQNNFKYTGQDYQHKEFSDGSGLELYDYIARGMDPQTGRFLQMDPIAEMAANWSPYRYAFDNPVSFNDPTGMLEGQGENVTVVAQQPSYMNYTYSSGFSINFTVPTTQVINGKEFTVFVATGREYVATAKRTRNPWYGRLSHEDAKILGNSGTGIAIGMGTLAVGAIVAIPVGLLAVNPVTLSTAGAGGLLFAPRIQQVAPQIQALLPQIQAEEPVAEEVILEELSTEGVYIFETSTGNYVGQSKDILTRLLQHFVLKNGNYTQSTINKLTTLAMPGSNQTEREVYEHYLIQNIGIPLNNVVLPMGGRLGTYNTMIEGVIQKYGLPHL